MSHAATLVGTVTLHQAGPHHLLLRHTTRVRSNDIHVFLRQVPQSQPRWSRSTDTGVFARPYINSKVFYVTSVDSDFLQSGTRANTFAR